MRGDKGKSALCLRVSKLDDFIQFIEQEKQKKKDSIRQGKAVLNAATDVNDAAATIKSATNKEKKE